MVDKQWRIIVVFCFVVLGFSCQKPYSPSQQYGMQQGYMGPEMRDNFGMMTDTMRGMHHMMGQGYMGQEQQGQMMSMMGQMGGMMQEMGGPYGPEVQQRHRQQLQGMQQNLDNIAAASARYRAGAQIFGRKCNSCHPQGGNTIRPDLPLRGSPRLKDFGTFLAYIRNPRLPDGSAGAMPAFSETVLSRQQARELYQYVLHVIE